ncbi:MAG TPA: helix-turn-helix transcriptional regulator [Micavibrio sp.]|jgi:transcriptional regulator with XRE-family HTH domain
MSITTAQIRGARGILNWSQTDLAERTGISATSIGSIENNQSTPRASTLNTIQKAFEDAGIEFIGQEGMRQKTGDVRVLKGRDGFWAFYQDIFDSLRKDPGEVLVSNVNEREFEKWLDQEKINTHRERMKDVTGVRYKILIREEDTYFLATPDYAEYRWTPREHFSSVPFYVYGKKLAILLFDMELTVIVIDYPAVAEAYRMQFSAIWGAAIVPPGNAAKATRTG